MTTLFFEKIIALKVIRNADRSLCGIQQVLLTEELKEKIPVLGNWRWRRTWAANRMLKVQDLLNLLKTVFWTQEPCHLWNSTGMVTDQTCSHFQPEIPLWSLLFSSVLGLCDSYGFWPIIREPWGFITEYKHSWSKLGVFGGWRWGIVRVKLFI